MAIAIDLGEERPYVLKADRKLPEDDPNRTVWMLGALDPHERAKIQDNLMAMEDGDSIRITSGSAELKILKLGLRGCENFRDAAGNVIDFDFVKVGSAKKGIRKQPTDEFIARIHPAHRKELAEAINEHNTISEDEKGNSPPGQDS